MLSRGRGARLTLLALLATGWMVGRWLGPPPDLPRLYPSVDLELEDEPGRGLETNDRASTGARPGPRPGGEDAGTASMRGHEESVNPGIPGSRSDPARGAHGLALFNQGTREELMELSGLGPVLASRILESREREGPFESWDDLERVRGIGKKLTKRWKESLE